MDIGTAAAREGVIAFVDIGTSSVRLLLVRIDPDRSYSILSDEKEVVRLGEGVFVDQHLQQEAIEHTARVCKNFAEEARTSGASTIYAVATSATREAKNKKELLEYLKQETGLDVRIVSGLEEARLIYLGASRGVNLGESQALFIDIGGGSTNLIIGNRSQYQYLDTFKLGALRLTSLFSLPDETGTLPPARYALIQRHVRNATIRSLATIRQYRLNLTLGSSGTIENLAEIAAYRFFNRPREPNDVLKFDHLELVVETLLARSPEERREIPGISPHRAENIIAGAAILHTLMQDLEISEIHISEHGLCFGLLNEYLLRRGRSKLTEGMSEREHSVMQFGRACGFDEAHARNVARVATDLFDSAKIIELHDFGEWERELLEYAALLHDIGTFLSHTNHQDHTYYLVNNADLLGFDQTEINIIATLGFYHRKKRPKEKHRQYANLGKRSREIVRGLTMFLQLAESLDRSHTGVIRRVSFRNPDDKKIVLEIIANKDCQLEAWGVHNQRKAFKKTFGQKLKVDVIVDENVES